jgi:Domain of unknown function (DUF397)
MGNWRKSTYSDANGGDCVELASVDGQVMVRDTTNRGGLTLTVPTESWRDFLSRVR